MDTQFWYSDSDVVEVEYTVSTFALGGAYGDMHADVKETEIEIHGVKVLGMNTTPSRALIYELKQRIAESLE